MSYNVAEYIVRWTFYGLHDDEKMAHLFQTVVVFTNVIYTRTHTQARKHARTHAYTHTNTHTHRRADNKDENATHCILPKN